MKNLAFGFLTLALLAFGCKKENTPEENPDLLDLTFTGTVVNQMTQQPIANVPVHIIYGTMCCGGIHMLKGGDSTVTNSAGAYTLTVSYPKPAAAYRHFVHVPGYFNTYSYHPTTYKRHAEWMTIGFNESAVLPIDLADTIKIVDGTTYIGKINVLPAATVHLEFPYTIVPAADSIKLNLADSLTQDLPFGAYFLPGKPVTQVNDILEIGTLARKKYIITQIYNANDGTLRKTVIDSVNLTQGQLYNYQVAY